MTPKRKNTTGLSLKRFNLPILFLVLTILVACFFWWRWAVTPLNSGSAFTQTFVVKKGESLSSIAVRLEETQLIRNSIAFKIFVLSKGLSTKIQAGTFSLSPSLSSDEIAYTLTRGTADIWLTFPEGWRREEVAQRLGSKLDNFNLIEFLNLTKGKEGELFPDTYLVPKQASSSMVLKLFEKNFSLKFDRTLEKEAQKAGLSKKEVLILASLIERETKSDEDRAIVAGILIKRGENDWPLQIDATVQYILGKKGNWWPQINGGDLKIDSLYNTYKNKGLPPGPICNPGLASIKAVLYSQKTDFWFYLSDKTGKMHYAKTNGEHNNNIRKYLVD